jgi:RHS repeat-associated protein
MLTSHIYRASLRQEGKGVGLYACLILFALMGLALPARAQTNDNPERGTDSLSSYAVSDIERVNLTNGNVNLSIPLATLPPMAGGKLSWALRAVYNSKLWNTSKTQYRTQTTPPTTYTITRPQGGGSTWRIGEAYTLTLRESREDYNWLLPLPSDPEYNFLVANPNWYKLVLKTPDGSTHEFRPTDYQSYSYVSGSKDYLRGYYRYNPYTAPGGTRYYSVDGSYLWAVVYQTGNAIEWIVIQPDGTRIIQYNGGIQQIIDTNGNSIKSYWNSDPEMGLVGRYIQDERTGREIRYVYDPDGNGGNGQQVVQYQTVGGAWVNIQINFDTTVVRGKMYHIENPSCFNQEQFLPDTDFIEVRSIVLPPTQPGVSGRQFTFNYNSDTTHQKTYQWRPTCPGSYQPITMTASDGWGSLKQMTTPLGATVKYEYSLDSLDELYLTTSVNNVAGERITTKKVIHDGNDANPDIWTYTINDTSGMVNNPDGTSVKEQFYSHDPSRSRAFGGANGLGGLIYRTIQTGVTIERHWTQLQFAGANAQTPGGLLPFNPVVDIEYTTLTENGNAIKMSAKKFQHDFNGNVTQIIEYDWFDPELVGRDAQDVPTGVPGEAAVLRTTTTSFYNPAPLADSPKVYAQRVIGAIPPAILNAPRDTVNGSSQTRFSYDGQNWDVTPTLGNLTRISNWDDQNNKWLDTVHAYDNFGNRITTTAPKGVATTGDPNDFVTTFTWDPNTHATLTAITVNPLNGTGTQTTSFAYDYYTGRLLSETDVNGQTTTTDYANQLLGTPDPFLRPGLVTGPAVTSVVNGVVYANQRRQARTLYYDQERQLVTESNLNTQGDRKLKMRTTSDQLGRTIVTERNEDGTNNWTIATQNIYIEMGRVTLKSNPKRGTAANTDGWTRTTRDTAGRVIEVATFAGATPPTTTSTNWTGAAVTTYYANQTTVRDQANKQRRSVIDALGRLSQVDEMYEYPNTGVYATTNYQYDSLGNLRKVTQDTQQRFFMYDSLSRLIRAHNPEQQVNAALNLLDPTTNRNQWSFKYTYDDNGNLATKTNARNARADYSYDGLNRNTGVSYIGVATPSISRYYDTHPPFAPSLTQGNTKGRLVAVTYDGTSAGSYYGYDVLGRVQQSIQRTEGQNYGLSYKYDLAGNLTEQTYPSGRTISSGYDVAGRLNEVKKAGANWSYAAQISYTAHGAMKDLKLGNGLWEQMSYNSRLQVEQIGVGPALGNISKLQLIYGYGTSNNNGNVLSQTINIAPVGTEPALNVTQNYSYDALNRLESASEGSNWSQNYSYDRYGNRVILPGSYIPASALTPQNLTQYNAASNRLNMSGYSYDEAGNQTSDPTGRTFNYDAENRLVSSAPSNMVYTYYTYDGEGRRVKKVTGTMTTVFVYNAQGQLIAEYTNTDPGPGIRGTKYITADHLGSTRLVTSGGFGFVKGRYDYLAFGEEIGSSIGVRGSITGYGGTDSTRQKFTGYERDSETELDFAQARYYSSILGRFTSADDFTKDSDIADPQSWNKYIYVRNNPYTFTDPTGEAAYISITYSEDGKKGRITVTANFALYSQDKKLTTQEIERFIKRLEKQVNELFKGEFQKDGVTFTVALNFSFTAVSSEDEAVSRASNAEFMNVVGLTTGESISVNGEDVAGATVGYSDENFDRIYLATNAKSPLPWLDIAALNFYHEVGHSLGTAEHILKAGNIMSRSIQTPRPTAEDFNYFFAGPIYNDKIFLMDPNTRGPAGAPGNYRPGSQKRYAVTERNAPVWRDVRWSWLRW